MTHLRVIFLTLLLFFLPACAPTWGTQIVPTVTEYVLPPTLSPFLPLDITLIPTVTRSFTPTPTNLSQTLWISPAVPDQLDEVVRTAGLVAIIGPESADVRLDVSLTFTDATSTWIYALVTAFPTTVDGVTLADLQSAWMGAGQGPFAGVPLLMEESTLAAFSSIWGVPASGAVRVEVADQLLDIAWFEQSAWGIVPFEDLETRWKVLELDGQSPIRNDFDLNLYPLKIAFSLQPPVFRLSASNRDPARLTTLVMTGVTAMVRSTAGRMVNKGLTYPGEAVRDTFRSADLLHISNEVAFAENCPYPYPVQESLVFCSDPNYITLLEDIGTDIVELTGNHVQDYGSAATLMTLDMYNERGWVYFGGGRNLADAQKASLILHNGNKLAFIGCNPAGPGSSWATETQPGSAPCDFDFIRSEITRLRGEGYLPIFTFQHYEYYSFYPSALQMDDFRSIAEAGAVVVSGSHAHFPQFMEFSDSTYIHYGLGNLFFDQMDYPAVGTRREFADRHVFYDGNYISVELLTFLLEDYARPRPMEIWERDVFLEDIFFAAGWR